MDQTGYTMPENMTITPVGVHFHIGLTETDWVITCGCGWECRRNSLNDALVQLGPHVTWAHKQDVGAR